MSLSPPFIVAGPGRSMASCGIATSVSPSTVSASAARAPDVGMRWTSRNLTDMSATERQV